MQNSTIANPTPKSSESRHLELSQYVAQRERLGELDCITIRPANHAIRSTAVAVFCHGFGAGGDDLVGVAEELLSISTPANPVTIICPAACLDLTDQGMPGGRAWWHLSIARLIEAMEEGRFEQIRAEVPDGIETAREQLTELIGLALARESLDESRLLLGGFSQGAMLAMETACLGLANPPGQMVLYSGALISEQRWKPKANRLLNTQIYQSHGKMDPILPLRTGIWLRELLQGAGCTVRFVEFNGPHTIPISAIESTAQMLTELAG